MHDLLIEKTVELVRRRIAQGDCPAEPPKSIEWLEDCIDSMQIRIDRYRAALDKLARLGNEPHYGNSLGNEIARAALGTIEDGETK